MMSTTGSALQVFEATNITTAHSHVPMAKAITRVYVRLVFLRIGEIDTLNEKYQAQISIESRWPIEPDKALPELSNDDQKRLQEGKPVSLINYAQSHWHPQLYIENALGDLKEQIRYTAKRSRDDHQIYICEHRDIKGVFWEKLELNHFPSDVQDLSISVASMFYDDKVLLVKDPYHLSGVNREAFVDQQEWSLYEHVDAQERYVREFLFDGATHDDEDEDQQINSSNHTGESNDRKRPIVTITCHAARQSNYFYWNGYCLIFLITVVSFCIFGIPAHLAANRIQISCTLLLTSITFRWTVNRSLPTISYLTTMDKYAILCIFILILQCVWHGIIGAVIFMNTPDFRITPKMQLALADQSVFFISLSLFLLMHVVLLLWLYFVPLKNRREMRRVEAQYRSMLLERKTRADNQPIKRSTRKTSPFARIPVGKGKEQNSLI